MSSQRVDAETATTTVPLGEVTAANSRHAGRRSAVALAGEVAVVGTADGTVRGVDTGTGERPWTDESGDAALVSATPFGSETVVVGERGHDGEIRAHDVATGAVRWRYASVADVGQAQKDTRFFLPFVADLRSDGQRVYAAARRYERGTDGSREFTSVVYAFDADGDVAWTYETDGSPIAMDCDGVASAVGDAGESTAASGDGAEAGTLSDRVAVGYNRCTGDHQQGLVVLDAADGSVRWTWDPGNDGQRRVGDVSLLPDGVAVTSHGDYRGYRLDSGGEERWRADLATPEQFGDETLYAYPNHVHATDQGVVFVTGNTYPEEGRQTESNHPEDHTVFGYDADGQRRWAFEAGGFVTGTDHHGGTVAIPVAQNFRERDASVHGYHVVDVADGHLADVPVEGIASAGAIADGRVAVVEEPVEYHDEGIRHGDYRLHCSSV